MYSCWNYLPNMIIIFFVFILHLAALLGRLWRKKLKQPDLMNLPLVAYRVSRQGVSVPCARVFESVLVDAITPIIHQPVKRNEWKKFDSERFWAVIFWQKQRAPVVKYYHPDIWQDETVWYGFIFAQIKDKYSVIFHLLTTPWDGKLQYGNDCRAEHSTRMKNSINFFSKFVSMEFSFPWGLWAFPLELYLHCIYKAWLKWQNLDFFFLPCKEWIEIK